ncbi:PREDICTED: tudor and KH domain-containing protein-like, partial [Lepidothrix coronata]|uniref:Tudor and KH domain-containing protein-like n=1 Tax=Lepidothrix coronata TaxID=321398 RepID=A0A6J0JB40_9PASS
DTPLGALGALGHPPGGTGSTGDTRFPIVGHPGGTCSPGTPPWLYWERWEHPFSQCGTPWLYWEHWDTPLGALGALGHPLGSLGTPVFLVWDTLAVLGALGHPLGALGTPVFLVWDTLAVLGALGHPPGGTGSTGTPPGIPVNPRFPRFPVPRQLRRETGAQIAVREAEEGEAPEEGALVRIWGSPARACRAKAAVLSLVADCAPVAEELRVPGRALGRIIVAPVQLVHISGTRREVEAAKRLILEKLSEDAAFRRDLAQAAASRCPRKQPLGSRRDPEPLPAGMSEHWEPEWWEGTVPGQRDGSQGTEEPELGNEEPEVGNEEPEVGKEETELGKEEMELGNEETEVGKELEELENGNEEVELGMELKELENGNEELENGNEEPENGKEEPEEPPVEKFEVPSPELSFPAEEPLEVFVSAAESPGHFWVQLLGSRSLQLDKLTREMGHYYGGTHPCPPVSVRPGDIVAAPYPGDGQWYLPSLSPCPLSPGCPLTVRLSPVPPCCPPVSVRPGDIVAAPYPGDGQCSRAGNDWEEAALEAFEGLTGCAQWRPLEAQLCSFCPATPWPRPSLRLFARHHGQVGHSGIPDIPAPFPTFPLVPPPFPTFPVLPPPFRTFPVFPPPFPTFLVLPPPFP